jgi:type II secretory pathway pseudopilin PulG
MAASSMPRGMTFIDVLIGIVLILIVFTGLFGAFQMTVRLVSAAKGEAGASELVSSEMEYMRSLSYADVGILNGTPPGVLAESTSFTQPENGTIYTIQTNVRYVDDPADGIGAADQNGITDDYKAVTVTVSWQAPTGVRSVSATSYVAPPGVETPH